MPPRPSQDIEQRLRWIEAWLASFEERMRRLEQQAQPPPSSWAPAPAPPAATAPGSNLRGLASRSGADYEALLGGNWLAKAGMAILVLGVVFFLTYAFEQGWINRPARIALGVVGGLLIVGLGDFLFRRGRYGVYPQVLAGGGAVITYFSLYAAYALPDYRAVTGFTLELDAVLLGLTALLLAVYAVWRDMPVLAAQAVTLGGLTTLFAQTWEAFAVFYLLGLAMAAIAAAVFRGWHYVAPLTLAIAYSGLLINLAMEVDPWSILWTAAGLLVVFTASVFLLRPATPESLASCQVLAAGAFLGSSLVAFLCLERVGWQDAQGPTTAGLALASLALAFVPNAHVKVRYAWGMAAAALALAWPPVQFDGTAIVLAWSGLVVAVAAVLWLRPARPLPWVAAAGAGLMSLHLYEEDALRIRDGGLGELEGLLAFGVATLALLVAWWSSRRLVDAEGRLLGRLIFAASLVPPLVYATVALDGYVVSIVWAAEALLLVLLGFAFSIVDLRLGGLGVFGLVLGRILIVDIAELPPALRIITFLAVGALILVASFFFARMRRAQKSREPTPPPRAAAAARARRP